MHPEEAIKEVAVTLHQHRLLPSSGIGSYEQLHQSIAEEINFLITNDFSRLISLLYRLDIPEKKLKAFLAQPGDTPAASIIAQMIIERQLQKIETRKTFRNNRFCDEEKW